MATVLDRLLTDAHHNGKMAGRHAEQALIDCEAHAMCAHLLANAANRSDRSPEEIVASHFEARWCRSELRGYKLASPLPASTPQFGLTLRERTRRECVRWFQAAYENYVPIFLSENEVIRLWRSQVRWAQLSNHPKELREHFIKSLGLSETELSTLNA